LLFLGLVRLSGRTRAHALGSRLRHGPGKPRRVRFSLQWRDLGPLPLWRNMHILAT
jgi:hypothetical protein